MRPLNKGSVPLVDGKEITVKSYGEWRKILIERIGYYCAYCNIPLSHNLNVEHVIPKKPVEGIQPGDALAWDNMLLACGPCNNAKSNIEVSKDLYYLPEEHNTLIPFTISEATDNPNATIIDSSKELNQYQSLKSQRTIELFALNEIDNRDKVVDIRWRKRKMAFELAKSSFYLYTEIKKKHDELLTNAVENIARTAAEVGFFIVWFEVFRNEKIVLEKLFDSEVLPGTSKECFHDNTFKLKPRNEENNVDPI